MESRGRGLVDETGAPVRLVGVAVDVTDRHLAEEHQTKLEHQLRQAHKLEAVGRLAGGVAHDFNNILLAIRGNGELALDALKDGDDAVEEVEEMVAASERAAALTAQLLAFSRQQVLQAEVLDLNEVVRDMDKLLRRMIGARHRAAFRPVGRASPPERRPQSGRAGDREPGSERSRRDGRRWPAHARGDDDRGRGRMRRSTSSRAATRCSPSATRVAEWMPRPSQRSSSLSSAPRPMEPGSGSRPCTASSCRAAARSGCTARWA